MAVNTQDWLDAQHSVLGSVLISPQIAPQVISSMTDSDFSGSCVALFQAMRYLFSQHIPIDAVTLRDKLGQEYTPFLMQLIEVTPTAANYRSYIDLAKKQARTHHLKAIGQQMADADSPEEVQRLLEQAIVINSSRQGLRAISMEEAVMEFVTRHSAENPPTYLPWQIREMNDKLFVDGGDYVILGGRPSAGKTAFALQGAWHMATEKNVGFFSLETGQKKLTDRQIADICDIPMDAIKRNAMTTEQWQRVYDFGTAGAKCRSFELIVDSTVSVAELQAFAAARRYDVIFIDYLQLLHAPGQNDYERVSYVSKSLHRFSQATGCVVVALSQLSRPGNSGGKIADPEMTSLRESGQLEQDADAVLLLYLEDEKNPNGRRVIKCAKNKDGERFRIMLEFDGSHQRFRKVQDFGYVQREMRRMAREDKIRAREEQLTLLPDDTEIPSEFEEDTQ